jgi:hypothetical protein
MSFVASSSVPYQSRPQGEKNAIDGLLMLSQAPRYVQNAVAKGRRPLPWGRPSWPETEARANGHIDDHHERLRRQLMPPNNTHEKGQQQEHEQQEAQQQEKQQQIIPKQNDQKKKKTACTKATAAKTEANDVAMADEQQIDQQQNDQKKKKTARAKATTAKTEAKDVAMADEQQIDQQQVDQKEIDKKKRKAEHPKQLSANIKKTGIHMTGEAACDECRNSKKGCAECFLNPDLSHNCSACTAKKQKCSLKQQLDARDPEGATKGKKRKIEEVEPSEVDAAPKCKKSKTEQAAEEPAQQHSEQAAEGPSQQPSEQPAEQPAEAATSPAPARRSAKESGWKAINN